MALASRELQGAAAEDVAFCGRQVAFSHLLWTLQLAKAVGAVGGTGQKPGSALVSEGDRSSGERKPSAWRHNHLMVKYWGLSLTWPQNLLYPILQTRERL